jgi:hypothetical protein
MIKYLLALILALPILASAQEPTLDKASKAQLHGWYLGHSNKKIARIVSSYDSVLVRIQRDTVWAENIKLKHREVITQIDSIEIGAVMVAQFDTSVVAYPDTTYFVGSSTETKIYRAPNMSDVVADVNRYLKGKVVTKEQSAVDDSVRATIRKVQF